MKPAFLYAVVFCAIASAADVTGRVVDAQTGKAIERARVTLGIIDPQTRESFNLVALTDEEGRFTFLNLTQSAATLTAERVGYLGGPSRKESSLYWNSSQTGPIVFSLIRQAVIEGKIVDETGKGSRSGVVLWRKNPQNGVLELLNNASNLSSLGDEFRFFGLEAGTYFVQAGGRQFSSDSATYPTVLYPHATDLDSAKPIVLEAGKQEHLEFRLEEVHGHSIRGSYTGSDGPSISLHLPGLPSSGGVGSISIDSQRQTFEISHVPPGTYILEISTWSPQAKATQAITVGDRDVDGVVPKLVPIPAGPQPMLLR